MVEMEFGISRVYKSQYMLDRGNHEKQACARHDESNVLAVTQAYSRAAK